MGHKARGIREDGAAFDVIPMAVAVDDVPNRNFESLGELLFHPGGKCRVNRIREDDAFRRHHEQREIVVVPRAIDVAFDIYYLAGGPALLGDEGACEIVRMSAPKTVLRMRESIYGDDADYSGYSLTVAPLRPRATLL